MSERDPLQGLYEAAPTITRDQIRNVLARAFSSSAKGAKCAKVCKSPAEFNLLLGWVSGDERWPVAALLLRRGLTQRGIDEYTYRRIAELVGRSESSVNTVLGSKGSKSVYLRIQTAWELMGGTPRYNELRFGLGLPSEVWVTLARHEIRSINGLKAAVKDGSIRRMPGFGATLTGKVTAALAGH